MKRKRYSWKFQRMAVERMRSSDNIGDLAKELGVGRRCLYKWEAKFDHLEPGEAAPRTNSHESSYRQQVHRLKRLLAEKTLEVDFFKGALQKVKARMFIVSFLPAASRPITPAGFAHEITTFFPRKCCVKFFAASSSTLLSRLSRMASSTSREI